MPRLPILVTMLALSPFALAWDDTGHKVIAHIAWDTLGKTSEGRAARDKFCQILMHGDEGFQTDGTEDVEDFCDAATFPDYIKRRDVEGPFIDLADKYSAETYPSTSPDFGRDHENNRCRFWHYFDTPLNLPEGTTPFVRPFDGKKALNWSVEGIAKGSDQQKAWWAYWLLHLTGDLHQPLHCVSDFSTPMDGSSGLVTGDNGGNGVKLSGRKNLHSYWDGAITLATGKTKSIKRRAKQIEDLYPADGFGAKVNDLSVDHWVADGAELAKSKVYPGITAGLDPSEDYASEASKVAMSQAALAGYRLAAIIRKQLG